MKDVEQGKLLYHLTKLSNLDSIIDNGLISRKQIQETNMHFDDVADSSIIDKRLVLGLDGYIPFHFHPWTSFDVAVKNKYSEEEFIYICIKRSYAKAKGFVVIPRHPLNVSSLNDIELLNYDEGIAKIDWDAMRKSSTTSNDVRLIKMAECLTDKIIPVQHFHSIAVKDEFIKKEVLKKLNNKIVNYREKDPYVDVRQWLVIGKGLW